MVDYNQITVEWLPNNFRLANKLACNKREFVIHSGIFYLYSFIMHWL